jgi:hypothetical protein
MACRRKKRNNTTWVKSVLGFYAVIFSFYFFGDSLIKRINRSENIPIIAPLIFKRYRNPAPRTVKVPSKKGVDYCANYRVKLEKNTIREEKKYK